MNHNLSQQLRELPAMLRPRLTRPIVLGSLAGAAVFVSGLGDPSSHEWDDKLVAWAGALAFTLFGLSAVMSLAYELRRAIAPRVGEGHASVVRLVIVLIGALLVLIVVMGLLDLPVGQLVLGGALTGVLVGIAGQQTLMNLFAGLVLLYSRPFEIGDRVHIWSGPLGGQLEARVMEIGLIYVRLAGEEGDIAIPNSVMQSAGISRLPEPPPAEPATPEPSTPTTQPEPDLPVIAPAAATHTHEEGARRPTEDTPE